MEMEMACVVIITMLFFAAYSHACPALCSCSGARVDCYGKELTEIPEHLPSDVVHLDLQTNRIETVGTELQNLSSLETVLLRFNKISALSEGAFSNLPSLKHVNLGSNLITTVAPGVFQNVPKLDTLDLTDNQIASIEGSFQNLSSLTKLVLTRNRVEQLTEDGLQSLTSLIYLMVEENNLSRVTATAFNALKNLSYVSLSKNPLTAMDHVLSENIQLSYLDLSDCQLLTVPLGLPWTIRYLQLSKNNISRISRDTFRETRYLGIVILDENQLTEVESGAFSLIAHLEQIWLNGNQLTSFPSPIPSSVHTVSIEKNQVTEVINTDFPENSKMRLLSLNGNQISAIEPFSFSRLTALQKLYLSGNAISQLKSTAFAGLRNLTALEISRNPITHIDTRFAAGLHALELLDLSFVDDTEPFVKGNFFRDVPYLKTLKLRLSPSLAQHIITSPETLKSFYYLQNLDLRDNHLQTLETDLPRFFPNLESIRLAGNTWVCDTDLLWLHDWIQRQPDSFVDKDEVLCALPMHLAGAAIADLPYHAFFHTTTTINPSPSTNNDDFLGSGEVTTEYNKDFTSETSSRSNFSASIAEEGFLSVSTSFMRSTLRTSRQTSPPGDSDQVTQWEIMVEHISSNSSTETSSDRSNIFNSKVTPSVTPVPTSGMSDNSSAVHTQSFELPSKTTVLFTTKSTKSLTKSSDTPSESPPPLTRQAAVTSSPHTVRVKTLSMSSRPGATGGVVTGPSASTSTSTVSTSMNSTLRTTPTRKPTSSSTPTVPSSSRTTTTIIPTTPTTTTTTTTTSIPTTTPTTTTSAATTIPTTTPITSTTTIPITTTTTTILTTTPTTTTSAATTTTTTTPAPTTTNKSTVPSTTPDRQINNSGQRSPSVKGQTSINQHARKTTKMSSTATRSTSLPTRQSPANETTPTTTTTTTALPTTTISNPATNITTITVDDNHHHLLNDIPGYGNSQNRMPSVTDATGPTRTVVIAVSATLIALIALLIATAFVLRHRRQIQLLYHRRFTYTIEQSDTAFVLADQDDPDTLPQVMTPRYMSRSRSEEEEIGSRASVGRCEVGESGSGREGDDGIAMFMWKDS